MLEPETQLAALRTPGPALSRIQLLDPKTAEAIAAGEVIERPASVVKELVENSLDSGATEIEIHLEDGGKNLIEITDNGSGIHPQDLSIAVLRHATSKIRLFADLERLSSFGFRGEALPSINAVARLSILSRAKNSDSAHEWSDGEVRPSSHGHFAGSSRHGTRVRAAALFTEIPARLKFLKSSSAEVSAVREWIERLALTHPHVGFRLTHEKREILKLRPETEPERVISILADGSDYPLVHFFREEVAGLQLRLYWIQGLNSPQTRKLIQVVNRRAIRDRMVQQALLMAFKQALLPGQFPAVVAYLETPPQLLDVNVHPAKTEVRFLNSSQIFRFIEKTASDMIAAHGTTGFAGGAKDLSSGTSFAIGGTALPGLTNGLEQTSTQSYWDPASAGMNASPAPQLYAGIPFEEAMTADRSGTPSYSAGSHVRSSSLESDSPAAMSAQPQQEDLRFISTHPFPRDRLAGTLFQTYFLYDLGTELALIDQHAAHERIRFEKLKARSLRRDAENQAQALLIPEVVHYSVEKEDIVNAHLETLRSMGFDAENFGEGKLLFRSIPSEWNGSQLRIRLQALLERFLTCLEDGVPAANLKWDESKFEKLASEACHSAIRAGDRVSLDQAQGVVDELFRCEHPWNCPHGRPVVARVPKARFEEWFQRRV